MNPIKKTSDIKIPDAIRLFIQIATIFILFGMSYQMMVEAKDMTIQTQADLKTLNESFTNFRLDQVRNNADVQARLRNIEDTIKR